MAESPSVWREWIEMGATAELQRCSERLPPCGGSGLKCKIRQNSLKNIMSPSIRREWIEIGVICGHVFDRYVSLHTEGVD